MNDNFYTYFTHICILNSSTGLVLSGCFLDNVFFQAETFDWRMATLTKRPANLPDKTYGAPVGYAYFDIFNTGSRCVMIN